MNLKNLLYLAALVIIPGLAGCTFSTGWNGVEGNRQITNSSRAVANFDKVAVAGSGELTITQGTEEGLTIETDENLLPFITSEVVNGTLHIGPSGVNLRPTKSIRYQLKLKNLNGLSLSGSLQADAGTIKTEGLSMQISGSGGVRVGHLEAKELSAGISGSGSIVGAGEVQRLELHISGSGSLNAPDLVCSRASAHISGSGQATLFVKEDLSAHISGSGSVGYYGSPQVNSAVSGSGRVHRLGDR